MSLTWEDQLVLVTGGVDFIDSFLAEALAMLSVDAIRRSQTRIRGPKCPPVNDR